MHDVVDYFCWLRVNVCVFQVREFREILFHVDSFK